MNNLKENKLFQNLTASEMLSLSQINMLQEKYMPLLVNQSFPGLTNDTVHGIDDIDWILIMLNHKDPGLFIVAYVFTSRV